MGQLIKLAIGKHITPAAGKSESNQLAFRNQEAMADKRTIGQQNVMCNNINNAAVKPQSHCPGSAKDLATDFRRAPATDHS